MNRLIQVGIFMLMAFVFLMPATQAGPSFDNDELHISVDVDNDIQSLALESFVMKDLKAETSIQGEKNFFPDIYRIVDDQKYVDDIIVVPINRYKQDTIQSKNTDSSHSNHLLRDTGHVP